MKALVTGFYLPEVEASVAQVLRIGGFDVTIEENLDRSLEKLRVDGSFDLVIVEHDNHPTRSVLKKDHNGVDFLYKLRDMRSERTCPYGDKEIRILMFMGFIEDDVAREALALGAETVVDGQTIVGHLKSGITSYQFAA